jgi:NUMOD4 motif-containing protein
MPELWLPVRGYAGWYEVSTGGEVVSLPRATTPGGPLAVRITVQGYRQVRLSKYGRVTTLLVGQIVLETFVSPRPPGKRVRHGPAGKLDDSLGNLWWG